jgi:hypothetical protein
MQTSFLRWIIPVVVAGLALTACGDDAQLGTSSTVAATDATSVAPTTTSAPATVTDASPATTTTAATTTVATTALPSTTVADPNSVSVTVGVDSGPERVATVALGSEVKLVITNPNSVDEFHLHGYDLGDGQEVPAGQPVSYTFVANEAGSFTLESHETNGVLLTLIVE